MDYRRWINRRSMMGTTTFMIKYYKEKRKKNTKVANKNNKKMCLHLFFFILLFNFFFENNSIKIRRIFSRQFILNFKKFSRISVFLILFSWKVIWIRSFFLIHLSQYIILCGHGAWEGSKSGDDYRYVTPQLDCTVLNTYHIFIFFLCYK